MSQLPERLETYLCSFVSQSARYAFELETGGPGELLASTLLLWAKTAANENIRCATVNAICGLITASEGAREKIYSQNGLQIVADCLHTSNTENSISACAQTLTALARTSRDRKVLCCHRYAVSDLVQASQTRSEATSKKCAACLKEIALEYSCHQLLLKCCALEATSIFLRKRPADAAVKLLLIFWHNLSCTKSSWARFGPHLDILNVYLKHSSAAMQSLTLCILCNVLSHPGNCEHFGRQAVFQSVMDHNSPLSAIGVSTKACFVLQNALRFSAHCRKTFAEKGGVSMMMRLVLIYEESDIRESALTVALMTIQHIPTECYHVLSSITQLLEILSYDLTTFEVAVRILKLLSFLAKIDDATRQKIVAANAISVIVQFFITPDNLGDSVVLKHQKDGDRILALKIGTAFMSLLSHSKKVLTRLVSHGGLAMIISVLAEHSVSPLPEEIVVNSSIFLANLSADRKGLNDIVLTCGIPVILKSAVVIATAICSSQSELHSPYRMRKFPALRGLPSSPQGTIPPYENCSQAIVNSPENIKLGLDVESAKAMGVTNSSVSGQLTSINNEGTNTSSETESTGLLVKHTESPAVLAPDGLPMPKSLVTAPNLAPENLLLSPDAASSKISLHDGGAPASDGFSWLSLVGKPVASRLIKCIICASIARFESTESAVECCLNQVIDRIESVANEEKAPKEVENVIEGQIVVINDATIALESHDSKFFVEASHCIDELHQKPDVEEAKLGKVDVHASLRLTVEDIITRAEEFIEQRARGGQCEDVVPVDDRLEWLKTIDVEDIWGKEKFFDFEKSICASDFDAHFQKQKKQINGKRSTSISLLCYKMTNVGNMLTNSSRQKSHCSLGTPGTALALLVKCLQNLCAGEPAARKQMLECGGSSFLIACIIPITGTKTSRSRALEGIPVAVPHMIDTLGLSVRLDAAGALSNLALSEQTRQNLMSAGIFEVLEEVGAWDKGVGEHQAGFNGHGGSRLLREPKELIDRLASFLRTMCGDEKCRRRVRSSSKLQSLASVMPVKLSEYSKYQENGMQHGEVICTSAMYTTKFIVVDRKLSAEHA